jgi:hypothetical protein
MRVGDRSHVIGENARGMSAMVTHVDPVRGSALTEQELWREMVRWSGGRIVESRFRLTAHTVFGVATAEPYGATRWPEGPSRRGLSAAASSGPSR